MWWNTHIKVRIAKEWGGAIFKPLSHNFKHKYNTCFGEQTKTCLILSLTKIKVNIAKQCQSNNFETLLCSFVMIF